MRAFILLGLALAFAAVSVVLARTWLERQGTAMTAVAGPPVARVPVVVAAEPLDYGDVVTADSVRLAEWPADVVPDVAFSEIAALLEQEDGVARVVLQPMAVGEPVLASKVSGAAGAANLASRIAAGQRAVTIPVGGTRGIGGFLRANDRVDVMLTRDRNTGATPEPPVAMLLLNAKVLAADGVAGPAGTRASAVRSVTLEVSPEEAQKLALAETLGTLSLALRHVPSRDERDAETVRSATLQDLIGTIAAAGRKAPPTAEAAPAPPPRPVKRAAKSGGSAIRVFRGLEAANYRVEREAPARPQQGTRP